MKPKPTKKTGKGGRTKHKTSKLIEPGNSRERNRLIAELGEFAVMPEWELAFIWRWRAMLSEWRKKQPKRNDSAEKARVQASRKLNDDIGEAIRPALLRGDWQFFDRLAKLTKFFAEQFEWKADSISQFGALLAMQPKKGAQYLDPVCATISHEYSFHSGNAVNEARKSRKTFMSYIARKMNRAIDERGAFAKAFDRACKSLGIGLRGKVDNS